MRRSETPVSANAIHRALARDVQRLEAEVEHYRRVIAAERAARQQAEARLRHAAQYTPTVALDLTPATRPDLYAVARIEGAA